MGDQDGTFSYVHSSRYSGRCITKLVETLKKLITNNYSIDNVSEVRVNLEELTKEFESYKQISSRGFNLASVSKDAAKPKTEKEVTAIEDEILAELEKVKKSVLPVIAKSKSYISEFEAQQVRESMNNSSMNMTGGFPEPNVKLPRIDIPKFDGVAIENFLEFYAIFQNVVHEEATLSKVKKLYYLKLALIGEAHDLVKDTPVTDKGYDEAWCLVTSTYKDIKSITRRHFDQLFSINRIKSTSEIPQLLSNVNRALKGLRACGEDTENWGPILCYIVSEKLDNVTYEDFEKSLTTNTKFPRWSVLKSFLENRASVTKRSSDLTKPTKRNDTPPSSSGKRSTLTAVSNNEPKSGPSGTPQSSPPKPACSCCDKLHLLIDCNVFRDKTPKQRYEIIKSKSLCGNCFHSNHRTNECRKQPNCKKCSSRHHTLLHFDKTNDSKDPPKPELNEDGSPRMTCGMSSLVSVQKPIALLPSALVNFVSGNKCGTMRVLLDSCSQLNLITNEFIKRNDLSTTKAPYPSKVAGIGDSETECNQIIEFSIESRVEDFEFCARFTVINNRIPYSVTNYIIGDFAEKVNERRLNLADTAFYDRNVNINSIDAILGVEAYNLCVRNKTIFIESACLRDTVFGWTISSSIESARNTRHSQPYCGLTIDNIDQRLERFWKIDSYPDSTPKSTEHEECQKHFMRTYQRAPDGRFIVQLPFKEDPSVITGNFGIAVKYLKRIESKLDETTKRMYTDFMAEYEALKHMSVVSDDVSRYYIPHHAVLRPSSTTTKLRVVFHASSKSYSGKSLNDVLMVGPTIQPELNDTLLCFRTFCKVISADIQHMYRCIEILKAHRRFQSIIWRGKRHELNTITYGTAPAAYEATQCLDILAEEVKVTRPRTSIAIRKGFYMDDWLYGADTDEELIKLQQSVHETLLSAGFKLRKYQSNSNEVLAKIDPALIEHNLTVQFGDNEALSILGLAWCPSTDSFALKTDVPAPTTTVTKCQMLSTISKVFDPLGLACPVTIRGKLLFKRLWKLGISWDDPVTPEIDSLFNAYLSDLNRLSKFVIPRYVQDFDANTETIVGFCDASEQAYCAAVYAFNAKRLQLLCSKTRVAPEKELNIPQLEFQAAVLLVQLIQRVSKTLNVDIHRSKLFTDSTIVLAWLSKPASEWKTFVRNRVVKITEVFPIQHWSHVRSGENPADLATRGISTESLLQSSMWLSGPEFVINLNNSSNNTEIDETICEPYRRKTKIASFIAADLETDLKKHAKLISSCESYEKLRFMYAAAIAVIRHWKSRILNRECVPLKVEASDMIRANECIIRIVQYDAFSKDIERLKTKPGKLSKRSLLKRHTPFLDENGIMKSKTRLQNARKPVNAKLLIVLPAHHHFTKIFIRYFHLKFFHAGRPWLMTTLSTNYVFVGGLNRAIKSIIQSCKQCIERFVESKLQQMANLPYERVTPLPPFQVVGIDFTGAFLLKCSYHRTTKYMKAYACIFVCFSTRAVHIELVPSLSTEDFLNALKCFVSRRGLPATIYSDNGTNFKGCERYLNFNDTEIQRYALSNTISWKFNPPYTPHRGGIWESAVKSAKRYIPKISENQKFTENELRTLLTQIEGILNTRPLAYSNTGEPDEEILTPGHFLVGRNLNVNLPEPSSPPANIKLSDRYVANQNRIRAFWRIWSQDYLNQLRSRTKWQDEQPNYHVGDLILLRKPNTEPCQWIRAIIIKTFPDEAGLVRTVEVRTSDRLSKVVPIQQIVPLPIAK